MAIKAFYELINLCITLMKNITIIIVCSFLIGFISCHKKNCCDFISITKNVIHDIANKNPNAVVKMMAVNDKWTEEKIDQIIKSSSKILDTLKNFDQLSYQISVDSTKVFGYTIVNVILHKDSMATNMIQIRYLGSNSPYPGKIEDIIYFRSSKDLFDPVPKITW